MQPLYSVNALQSFARSQDLTAHNVANINTDEYKSKRLDLETGPEGRGVRPAQVVEDPTPGPVVQTQQPVENEEGRVEQKEVRVEGSNTDLAREITQMIADERAMEANAQVVRTHDHMAGTIIDILV
ncbi:MAG: flagellar basal body rod C-terminal domain-containing protein [Desulfonatronovibrio sp.]